MNSALIIGATGEIGNALIRKLIKENINVTAICRPASQRIQFLPDNPRLTVLECDLRNLKELDEEIGIFDACYYLGWLASYGDGRNDLYLQTENIRCILDAISLAKRCGCTRFIGAGSQAEYGVANTLLRSDTPTFPNTPYGIIKCAAGKMALIACESTGMEFTWVRVCSVYGPFDGPNTLITYIIKQLKEGRDIELTPCEQIWDYLYADDAAEIFYRLVLAKAIKPVYCISGGNPRPLKDSLMELSNYINDSGLSSKLIFGVKDYSPNQIMYLAADMTELYEDIGEMVMTDFYTGIRKTYEMSII